MSDETTTSSESNQPPVEQPAAADQEGGGFRAAVNYLVLAGLGLTLLVAGLQFYTSVSAAINQFVAREFRPLVRAVFNLGLVVLAAGGVSIQLRRMSS